MAQKIETGGTSKTSTPIFKFRANELFPPTDARHIAHCAIVDSENNPARIKMAITVIADRIIACCRLQNIILNSNDSSPRLV
jgi:hypothetical protein